MKKIIILAMHGMPPKDFPRNETSEFFRLNAQLEHVRGDAEAALRQRHAELDAKMRNWPRNAQNDPYRAWSLELATSISEVTGNETIAGFNEFCAPNLDEAIDQAVEQGAEQVIVVTPMMTRGGDHSEIEIPEVIDEAKKKYPQVSFVYTWPFNVTAVAQFLANHIGRFT